MTPTSKEASKPWTPGPWNVLFSPLRQSATIRARATGGAISGVVASMNIAWPHEEQRIEQSANAHLIAASPTMYEALKEAETFEASLISDWPHFWDVAPQRFIDALMKAQEMRNAALSLARTPERGVDAKG